MRQTVLSTSYSMAFASFIVPVQLTGCAIHSALCHLMELTIGSQNTFTVFRNYKHVQQNTVPTV